MKKVQKLNDKVFDYKIRQILKEQHCVIFDPKSWEKMEQKLMNYSQK